MRLSELLVGGRILLKRVSAVSVRGYRAWNLFLLFLLLLVGVCELKDQLNKCE